MLRKISLAQDAILCRAFANTAINFGIPKKKWRELMTG
jgi:hypothetical protein